MILLKMVLPALRILILADLLKKSRRNVFIKKCNPIAKDGHTICGVDYTSSMLEQAKVKASEAGLKIVFIEADIRTLNLQEKFDLIFIPFNSIHHFI